MRHTRIAVVTTTISGSISDWSKVRHIVPLFAKSGHDDVSVSSVDTHWEARIKTRELVDSGSRIIISAGGSGTFNSVLEGCLDSGINLSEIKLGFLRKGSADVLGKTLDMPDDVGEAVRVLSQSIRDKKTVKCDVIRATCEADGGPPRHFVGFAGAEIFGEIPRFTESRFVKYYKGILGQVFGDLGPFTVGAVLATLRKILYSIAGKRIKWQIFVDGQPVAKGHYQALIVLNGDLGPDLPFAKWAPLGSGEFYLITLRDMGLSLLPGQFKHAWDASVLGNPETWGFASYTVRKALRIAADNKVGFSVNVDGMLLPCSDTVRFDICGQVALLAR